MSDEPSDLTDGQRIIGVEAAYTATPGPDRAMHQGVQAMLCDGVPMDQVVRLMIGVIVENTQSHAHPVSRAAAMLCMLNKLPGWVYHPFDEAGQPPDPGPAAGVPADVIREAVWAALDAETGYTAEMHSRVRQIMTMTTPADAFERLALLAVKSSAGKYDDPAGRAAEVEWHMRMIVKWMAEPVTGEN